ncbi:AraC family transcriptional regulator [Paenibacillus sp. CC-CFT747]|nr:AraC family transcriptional regulator [Paenibacillus sp. CC-CFT747]
MFLIPPNTPHLLASVGGPSSYKFIILEDVAEPAGYEAHFPDPDRWNAFQSIDSFSTTLMTSKIFEAVDFVHHLCSSGTSAQNPVIQQACTYEVLKILQLMSYQLEPVQDSATARDMPKTSTEIVQFVINYLEWRYREPITITAISKLMYVHPSYLIRIFREQTGITPARYLQNLRIKAAASYLASSDMPIRVIVDQTGFNSVHYFTRLFTLVYGMSPAKWRKDQRNSIGRQ